MSEEAPVPIGAQIEKVRREIVYAREDHAEKGERLWSAVLASLQQHEDLRAERDDFRAGFETVERECREAGRKLRKLKAKHERAMAALRIHEQAMSAMIEALHFYADPETYFALAVIADPPCGAFAEDFSDDHGHPSLDGGRYGKTARAALTEAERILAALDDAASAAGDAG